MAQGLPPSFRPVEEPTDTGLPPSFRPAITEPAETIRGPVPENPSMIGQAWDAISKPLTDLPSRFAKSIGDYINQPSLATSPTGQGGFHDYLAGVNARMKGFGAGALQGAGDLVSGLTSPVNLGTALLSGGESLAVKQGLPEIASALRIGSKVAAAPTILHGAGQTLSPDSTLAERGMGLAEMAGGGAALLHTPTVTPKQSAVTPPEIPTLYHGTRSAFENFDTSLNQGHGLFPGTTRFTENPEYSQLYSLGETPGGMKRHVEGPEGTPNTIAAKVGAKNVLDLTKPIPPEQMTVLQQNFPQLQGTPTNEFIQDVLSGKFGNIKAPIPFDAIKYSEHGQANWAVPNETPITTPQGVPLNEAARTTTPTESTVPTKGSTPVDPFAKYREVPVGTKYTIAPENMNRKKLTDAIKLGFDVKLDENGKLAVSKVRESPSVEEINTPEHKRTVAAEIANLPRTLMATMDVSAPLRQGLGLIHKKAFWTSLPAMFRAFGNEEFYNGAMDEIASKPLFRRSIGADGSVIPSFAEKAGLKLTNLLGNREESIMSGLLDKVPGIGGSERAYTLFLNKLRADTFEQMVKDFGVLDGKRPSVYVASQIADFVNNASGRGKLPTIGIGGAKISLEQSANALSTVLFSPRLIASRLQMMGRGARALVPFEIQGRSVKFSPEVYMSSGPNIRREYLKSLFAVAATASTFAQLARLGGATVESDPASADFGKAKFGNTRIDPYGGFQQYIVLAQRLMPNLDLSSMGLEDIGGKMKSTVSEKEYSLGDSGFGRSTRADVLSKFIRSKTNPIINFAWGMFAGQKEAGGKQMDLTTMNPYENAISQRFIPMLTQDIYDLVNDETTSPSEKSLAAFMGSLGAGVQTYGNERQR